MATKDKQKTSKSQVRSDVELPSTSTKTPSTHTSLPTTSKIITPDVKDTAPTETKKPWKKKCFKYMFDKEHGLYCGRTCQSWWYMFIYSVMYLMFLSTYTMIFLYATLTLVKMTEIYQVIDKSDLMAYTENGIGLTAVPASLDKFPLISYTSGESNEYSKYVEAIDKLLVKRRKREVSELADLGPCGTKPYGYGDTPCIILRINKQMRWSANPYNVSATRNLPKDLKSWLKMKEQKLWLHCDGYHSYDKEHIGRIRYYPHPPGFDPGMFPLDVQNEAPLIAIQLSNFTIGLSLAIECKLWHDSRFSSIAFLLYVEPKNRSVKDYKM